MKTGDYDRIERAIRYIDAHRDEQPSLDEIAAHLSLSPFHFQRLFSDWAGISPKKFLQCLTLQNAKKLLDSSRPVLEAALESGLSSPSRLHDLFVTSEAVTPGEYGTMGKGLSITYGFAETPFGTSLMGITPRGICWLSFLHETSPERELSILKANWVNAEFSPDNNLAQATAERIFHPSKGDTIKVFMKGTNFQLRVWNAILNLPEGTLISYSDVAHLIGNPSASRAVGSALGRNTIGYLIPCHRVLRETGAVTGYRWGTERKKAMIAYESRT